MLLRERIIKNCEGHLWRIISMTVIAQFVSGTKMFCDKAVSFQHFFLIPCLPEPLKLQFQGMCSQSHSPAWGETFQKWEWNKTCGYFPHRTSARLWGSKFSFSSICINLIPLYMWGWTCDSCWAMEILVHPVWPVWPRSREVLDRHSGWHGELQEMEDLVITPVFFSSDRSTTLLKSCV